MKLPWQVRYHLQLWAKEIDNKTIKEIIENILSERGDKQRVALASLQKISTDKDDLNGEAHALLGFFTMQGVFFKHDQKKALELYALAAKKGSLQGLARDGARKLMGLDGSLDEEGGLSQLLTAANKGLSNAYILLCTHYLFADNTSELLHWANSGAEKGVLFCCEKLGSLYIAGEHVKKDIKKGMELLVRAAEGGWVEASYHLGLLYLNDPELKNPVKAFLYLTKAVKEGYPNAIAFLADCYFNGIGCKQDVNKGFELLSKAVKPGLKSAKPSLHLRIRSHIEQYMSINGPEKTFDLLKTAADCGVYTHTLAKCYEEGIGVKKDPIQAKRIYEKLSMTPIGDRGMPIEMDPLVWAEILCVMMNWFENRIITQNNNAAFNPHKVKELCRVILSCYVTCSNFYRDLLNQGPGGMLQIEFAGVGDVPTRLEDAEKFPLEPLAFIGAAMGTYILRNKVYVRQEMGIQALPFLESAFKTAFINFRLFLENWLEDKPALKESPLIVDFYQYSQPIAASIGVSQSTLLPKNSDRYKPFDQLFLFPYSTIYLLGVLYKTGRVDASGPEMFNAYFNLLETIRLIETTVLSRPENGDAAYFTARRHERGHGTPVNVPEALTWYRKAVDIKEKQRTTLHHPFLSQIPLEIVETRLTTVNNAFMPLKGTILHCFEAFDIIPKDAHVWVTEYACEIPKEEDAPYEYPMMAATDSNTADKKETAETITAVAVADHKKMREQEELDKINDEIFAGVAFLESQTNTQCMTATTSTSAKFVLK